MRDVRPILCLEEREPLWVEDECSFLVREPIYNESWCVSRDARMLIGRTLEHRCFLTVLFPPGSRKLVSGGE